jgi:hypothetical protein
VSARPAIALPDASDPLMASFWAASKRHVLMIQRCGNCGEVRFPPLPVCSRCWSADQSWVETDPAGAVYSYVVYHRGVGVLRGVNVVAPVEQRRNSGVKCLERAEKVTRVGVLRPEVLADAEVNSGEVLHGEALKIGPSALAACSAPSGIGTSGSWTSPVLRMPPRWAHCLPVRAATSGS